MPRWWNQFAEELDAFDEAVGLSFPCGALAAITFTLGRIPCSVSQQRARSASYSGAATAEPSGANWGRQKWREFGSFQITTTCTVANWRRRRATSLPDW